MGSGLLGSLRVRTAAAYVLLIVAAFAALGVVLADRVERAFRDDIEADLASQTRMVANLVMPLVQESAPPPAFDRLAKDLGAGTRTQVTLIASDGSVLGDSQADAATTGSQASQPEVREALRSGLGESTRQSTAQDTEFTYVALSLPETNSVIVRVGRPSGAVDAAGSEITRAVLIAVAAASTAAALLSLALGATVTAPLAGLTRAARSIAAGNLGERIARRPAGEVGALADAFNEMAHSVDELVAAASQERNRLIAALNSSADAVLAVDPDGRVTFANAAAERLLSRRQDELVGNPFSWVMANEQVVEALRSSSQDGRRQAIVVEQPDGQHLQVLTTAIVGGGDWAALVVCHDITDVKRTEQVRRDFVANVSHELRTPLAAIKSVIETLQDGALEDLRAAREFLGRADAEVDRLVRMVEELLELSRIESGELALSRQPVELEAVAESAVERMRPQAERKGLRLSLAIAPGLPSVLGDAERLERALINLIRNAIEFTPSAGAVHVTASTAGGAASVEVRDTGPGISPADLPRVFERFYKAGRARGAGTGLGLAIVKHTIEAHGGTVSVASTEGRGAAFTLSLPAVSPSLRP